MKLIISLSFMLIVLVGCSGENGGVLNSISDNENTNSPAIPPSEVETQKLVSAINAEPAYKIETSELEMLKSEGIINDADAEKLKTIQ